MNIQQAQRLSTVATGFRYTADGGLMLWTMDQRPVGFTAEGDFVLFDPVSYSVERDWRPLQPTPAGRLLAGNGASTPRYDLIDSIRRQIANGTYETDKKLEVAVRRMFQES